VVRGSGGAVDSHITSEATTTAGMAACGVVGGKGSAEEDNGIDWVVVGQSRLRLRSSHLYIYI
jgi:hypothetical protein